jgi:putative lipoic acid-binding regulatory protein
MTPTRQSLLQFPCSFPLKVIGRNVEAFELQVMSVILKYLTASTPTHCTRRLSTGNKYLALTISFMADSQEQIDAIYQELNGLELVLFTL